MLFGLFGSKRNPYKGLYIDNSDAAVRNRLDYLRYRDVDGLFSHPVSISEKVVETPRKIEFDFHSIGIIIRKSTANPTYQFPEDFNELVEYIKCNCFDSNEKIISAKMKYARDNVGWIETDTKNIVVDHHFVDVNHLRVPYVLDKFGLTPERWRQWVESNLYGSHWYKLYSLKYQTEFDLKRDGYGPEDYYRARIELLIDIKINGIDAYSYNLTFSERKQIIDQILSGVYKGEFQSDGKEDLELISKWDAAYGDAYTERPSFIATRINRRLIYGVRMRERSREEEWAYQQMNLGKI